MSAENGRVRWRNPHGDWQATVDAPMEFVLVRYTTTARRRHVNIPTGIPQVDVRANESVPKLPVRSSHLGKSSRVQKTWTRSELSGKNAMKLLGPDPRYALLWGRLKHHFLVSQEEQRAPPWAKWSDARLFLLSTATSGELPCRSSIIFLCRVEFAPLLSIILHDRYIFSQILPLFCRFAVDWGALFFDVTKLPRDYNGLSCLYKYLNAC